jgi:hypothetical protein
LNPHALLGAADFKSAVSADFTIRAMLREEDEAEALPACSGAALYPKLFYRIQSTVHLSVTKNGLNVFARLGVGD